MPGTERMACPDCGTVNTMVGVLNQTRQYRCVKCGMVYYTPDECLRESPEEADPDGKPHDDAGPPEGGDKPGTKDADPQPEEDGTPAGGEGE